MQLSGEGGGAKAHKTSFHAMANIARTEGPSSLYKGFGHSTRPCPTRHNTLPLLCATPTRGRA
jgi:hypothetical protein